MTNHPPLRASHFHILLTLVDGPVHGYRIRREVEARTGGAIVLAAGTLYETLGRLERDRLIVEASTPESEREANSRWRFYAITASQQRHRRWASREEDNGLATNS